MRVFFSVSLNPGHYAQSHYAHFLPHQPRLESQLITENFTVRLMMDSTEFIGWVVVQFRRPWRPTHRDQGILVFLFMYINFNWTTFRLGGPHPRSSLLKIRRLWSVRANYSIKTSPQRIARAAQHSWIFLEHCSSKPRAWNYSTRTVNDAPSPRVIELRTMCWSLSWVTRLDWVTD